MPVVTIDTDKINRIELINKNSRVFVRGSVYETPITVELSIQDDERTLKVFVNDKVEK